MAEVQIEGLTEFRKGLRKIDKDLQKSLGQANKRSGAKVVSDAQSRYPYTQRRGRVPNSIRASAAAARVQITLGRNTVPYALGQEFGSNRYQQFAPWTGRGPGGRGSQGRFFYPAIREETPKLIDEYLKELDGLAREAFPDG